MNTIKSLCDNQFTDDSRSKSDSFAGYLDHDARLQAVAFSGDLFAAALTAAQQESATLALKVRAAQVAVGTSQARQQTGRTATKAEQKKAVKRIQDNAAALQTSYFIPNAAERQRLYDLLHPAGLTTLTEADLKDLPDLLATYLDTVEDEKAALGQTFLDQTTADLAPFTTTRDTQIKLKSATAKARDDRDELLDDIDDQLNYNYHLLSAHHRTNLSAVAAYYDPRYFDNQAPNIRGQRRGGVPAGQTEVAIDLGAADAAYVSIRLTVTDGEALEFVRVASAADPAPATWLRVVAGTPQHLALSALPGTGGLLLVRNATAKAARYRLALEK